MVKKSIVIQPEERAYGGIIEALSGGLYPNKFHVIREYIQNSFDATKKWKLLYGDDEKLTIKITIQKPSVFIFDNAIGMDRKTLNEYRHVGYSRKKLGEFAGFRGIGKLAGISVAKKLIVTTSPKGLPEKYILTFDSDSMLKDLKKKGKRGESIPLNKLIDEHTEIISETEKSEEHYTMVELHRIKTDSKILFNKNILKEYVSKNAPVGFDPKFEYGEELEEQLKRNVYDYETVSIFVDKGPVFKSYIEDLKRPYTIPVYNKSGSRLLAFCWYCENRKKGQIKPIHKAGLVYKYKNITVGDNNLPRTTLWAVSPHLSFYFIGEIHICDNRIIPTSQRDDFEQNDHRKRLYTQAAIISKQLNGLARKNSSIRRAIFFVKSGNEIIEQTEKDLESKSPYLKDLHVEKISQIFNVVENIKKRKRNIPDEDKKNKLLADGVIKRGEDLLKELKNGEKFETTLDIGKKIRLNKQAKGVYLVIIRTLKDYYVDDSEKLETIIKLIHKSLIDFFSKRNKK